MKSDEETNFEVLRDYVQSVNNLINNITNKEQLIKIKSKLVSLYNEGENLFDIPYDISVNISRLATRIDKKIKDHFRENKIHQKTYILNSDHKSNYSYDDFIGEEDDGSIRVFTQKDLKTKFVWPLNKIIITSVYGFRNDPFVKKDIRFHHGLDLYEEMGARVRASNSGVVVWARKRGGYGLTVMIRHNNNIKTLYAHLSKISVSENSYVNTGQKIGEVGSTGKSTGTHLHFEIRKNDKSINPILLLEKK